MTFLSTFGAMWLAIFQLFLTVIGAALFVHFKLVPERFGKDLSGFIIRLLLPCLIFSKVIGGFYPDQMPGWWLLPLLGALMSLAGIGLASLLFIRQLKEHMNLLPLAGIQNAGFLVLSVAVVIFPEDFDRFAAYVFLFLIGFDVVLWSLGKVLTTSGSDSVFKLKEVITPPLITMIASLIIVFVGLRQLIPEPIAHAAELLGGATVPMAMVVLGLTLGQVSLKQWPAVMDVVKIMSVKYLLLPLLTILLLVVFSKYIEDPIWADLMIIEASSAPATSIMIQISNYGGDHQKVGSMMIIAYGAVLFFLPFWLAVWRVVG